jgi:hypothetical protein
MYKVFIGVPSTKSIHGPKGKISFSNISVTYILIGVKLCGNEEDISLYRSVRLSYFSISVSGLQKFGQFARICMR